MMIQMLPDATFVSISHHDTLDAFHTKVLEISDDGQVATFSLPSPPNPN